MDEGSPNSIQSQPNVHIPGEELKDNMNQNNFFLNKMSSNSTSHDDLNTD